MKTVISLPIILLAATTALAVNNLEGAVHRVIPGGPLNGGAHDRVTARVFQGEQHDGNPARFWERLLVVLTLASQIVGWTAFCVL